MKKETMEEFLARGGKVEKLPYMGSPTKEEMKLKPGSSIMSQQDYELYCDEAKPPRKKRAEKTSVKIDRTKLPAELVASLEKSGVKIED